MLMRKDPLFKQLSSDLCTQISFKHVTDFLASWRGGTSHIEPLKVTVPRSCSALLIIVCVSPQWINVMFSLVLHHYNLQCPGEFPLTRKGEYSHISFSFGLWLCLLCNRWDLAASWREEKTNPFSESTGHPVPQSLPVCSWGLKTVGAFGKLSVTHVQFLLSLSMLTLPTENNCKIRG